MVTVFSAFALAESITIKSIGVGMAIAVLIDATIVRSCWSRPMRLMGKWNWWAPGPLGRPRRPARLQPRRGRAWVSRRRAAGSPSLPATPSVP